MTASVSRFAQFAAGCGFDSQKFGESLCFVAAAFFALLSAWALGLDHPQWAAITVLVTMQPSRGQTIEKNIYRFFGTLLGSGFGLVLLMSAGESPWIIAAGLALWSGACLFLGTLQRSYRSYGTVLAGYSAVIVAMNNVGPAEMVKWVALDRVASIFMGLVVGIALSYLIAKPLDRREFEQRTRRLLADMLRQAAVNLGQPRMTRPVQDYPIITAAAQLSSQLSTMSSHRNGPHQIAGPLQDLLVCATSLLMASSRAAEHPALAARLAEAGTRLHEQRDFTGVQRLLTLALADAHEPALEEALLTLASALPDHDGEERGLSLSPAEANWQFDWRGARQAGLRILIVTGSIGLVWAVTGQAIVQFALISAAIVVSLASSGVSPSRAMRDVSIGQCVAALSAILCERLFWAQGLDGLAQVLTMLPSLLGYAVIRAHRRFSLSSTDYALTLLLMLTPSHAVYQELYSPYLKGLMAVSGGLVGYVAFRWLFPLDATLRRKRLWRMIKAELQAIAAARPLARGSAQSWRLRFVARYLRIVDWTYHETRGEPPEMTMRKGLLTMALGDLIFALRRLSRQSDLTPGQRRAVAVALQRLSRSNRETPELIRALKAAETRLKATGGENFAETVRLLDDVLSQIDDLAALRHAKIRGFLQRKPA